MTTDCEILPEAISALLVSYGVGEMGLEWTVKGQNKGQPITLTLRWTPAKTKDEKKPEKIKSPSTKRHEMKRTEQYFERKRKEEETKRIMKEMRKENEMGHIMESDSTNSDSTNSYSDMDSDNDRDSDIIELKQELDIIVKEEESAKEETEIKEPKRKKNRLSTTESAVDETTQAYSVQRTVTVAVERDMELFRDESEALEYAYLDDCTFKDCEKEFLQRKWDKEKRQSVQRTVAGDRDSELFRDESEALEYGYVDDSTFTDYEKEFLQRKWDKEKRQISDNKL